MLKYAVSMKLVNLVKACCDFWIKKASEIVKLTDLKIEIAKCFGSKKIIEQVEMMLGKIGFDIAQAMIENEKTVPNFTKKFNSSNFNMEK